MKALLRLLAVVAASAVLLPLLGPLTDHHFAERQPGHRHVYLGQVAPDHAHPYQAAHAHDGAIPGSAELDVTESANSLLFFADEEGGFAGVYGFSLVAMMSSLLLSLLTPPMLRLLFPKGRPAFEVFTPRPDPPPPRLDL